MGFLVSVILSIVGSIDSSIGKIKKNKKKSNVSGVPDRDAAHSVCVNSANSSYRSVMSLKLYEQCESIPNIYEAFRDVAIKRFSDLKMLGTREIIDYEEEVQKNGKVFKKSIMKNSYDWLTYREVLNKIDMLSNGLLQLGIKSNDNLVIFSETRSEWLMSAFACFRIKVTVVTLYSTLGQLEGLIIYSKFKKIFLFSNSRSRRTRLRYKSIGRLISNRE